MDEDDDEETLQLKLQEIQARLKLKKLQASKAQKTGLSNEENDVPTPNSTTASRVGVRAQSRLAQERAEKLERPKSQAAIQVPASPVRKAQPPTNVQTSPSRVILGIDKGWKANDVSLKRAASLRKTQDDGQSGGYLQRSKSAAGRTEAPARPLSFNERLASARTDEITKREKQERIRKLRTKAFDLGKEEMERYKSRAVDIPDVSTRTVGYSRDEVLSNLPNSTGGYLRHSKTAPSLNSGSQPTEEEMDAPSFEPYSGIHLSRRFLPHQVLTRAITGKKTYVLENLLAKVKAPDFSLPDDESDVVIFAIIASKSDPKSHKPAYDSSGNPKPQADRGKYMVLTLVDLNYEVELFLFNTGFGRFWQLATGTVVALLNPNIMPPPANRVDTGRFSLVVNSDGDTVLEVGVARDLGYCTSVKKDGKLCSAWVNARRSEHCEFHTNEAVARARRGRTELNMMDFGAGGKGREFEDYKRSAKYKYKPSSQKRKEQPGQWDRETQSRLFVSGVGGLGPASLIDRDNGVAETRERAEGLKRRLAAKEKERDIAKRLGEIGGGAGRDYMRLGAGETTTSSSRGQSGFGSSLSSSATLPSMTSGSSSATTVGNEPRDARSLGLLAPKGTPLDIRLSPVKRKRPASVASTSTNGTLGGGKGGFGWGSSLKDKLARMKEGEKLSRDGGASGGIPASSSGNSIATSLSSGTTATGRSSRGDRSPVRKKTRFVTEKGIREAGRESLGAELAATSTGGIGGAKSAAQQRRQVMLEDDDDDDELVIVK